MISEMDAILLSANLKTVCPVCDGFLRMPMPGEKTLQKLQGMHNFALGFLGNASVAERAQPSISSNLKICVDAIKAKTKLSEPTKEII
jgi:hypothetical protein